jgi:hypothetical protein
VSSLTKSQSHGDFFEILKFNFVIITVTLTHKNLSTPRQSEANVKAKILVLEMLLRRTPLNPKNVNKTRRIKPPKINN